LIERLVPDTGCKVLLDVDLFSLGNLGYLSLLLFVFFFSLFVWDLIDFMDEDENVGILIELFDAFQGHFKIVQDLLMLFSIVFNFEHIN